MRIITCPACGAQAPVSVVNCDVCGTLLTPLSYIEMVNFEHSICPWCAKVVVPGSTICGNCGARLVDVPLDPGETVPGFCPNCHVAVRDDDLYCDNCGHPLRPDLEIPQPPQQPVEALSHAPDEAAEPSNPAVWPGPRLIVQPGDNVIHLMPDQTAYVIGREDPGSGSYPDVDLVPFGGEEGGVSRRHARIIRNGDLYFIEDLNSVNYTFVNRKKIAPAIEHPLQDEDEIRLGRVLMRFETG